MNIVNIGIDKTLVGGKKLGDAIERHVEYGKHIDRLDIIVYANKKEGLKTFPMSQNVVGHPTNSRSKIFFYFDAIKVFTSIQKNHKTDIVVCQDPFVPGLVGIKLKKKFGTKVQINFHGDFWNNTLWLKERFINRIFLWLSKRTVPKADVIRVMSEGQKGKLIASGVAEKKIHIVSTPVDVDRFKNFKKEISIPENILRKKIVLMVGRKDSVKDFKTLFEAMSLVFAKRGDCALCMVGNYEDSKNIPLDQSKLWLVGNIDTADLPAYFKLSELTVLSSTSESFGKVLIEANACGKPVVSTATTGGKEIVEDGKNGFLVPVKNPEKLAEKIIYLLDYPEEAKKMGQYGQKMVREKYGDNTQKIIELWKKIV